MEIAGFLRQKPRCASATAVDRLLDHAEGERLALAEPRYAAMVRDTLLLGDQELGLYELRAWVIHHNHVHVLMQPNAGTVHIAETLMDLSEAAADRRFWERESYERLIRDARELAEAVEFVEQHPMRLGLVARAGDWQWSSAFANLRFPIPFSKICTQSPRNAGGPHSPPVPLALTLS